MRRACVFVSAIAIAGLVPACATDTSVAEEPLGPDAAMDSASGSPVDAGPPITDATTAPADAAPGDADLSEAADTNPPPVPDSAPPDAGACVRVGQAEVCGVSPQCGCGANETCEVTSMGDTYCIGPAGLGVTGNGCVNDAACGPGLTCAYGGSCRPFCATAGQACGASNLGTCVQLTDDANAPIDNLLVCEINCQLQDANACGFGSGCFQSAVTDGATDCYSAGTSSLNQPCAFADDCLPGLSCVSVNSGAYHCKAWCRVGQNDCGAASCTGFNPSVVANGVTYGSCP